MYGVTLRREPLPSSATSEMDPSCTFVQYRTCKVRRLKAATLDGLVSHLLDPARQEADFGRMLLSSYRTFTDTTTLVELLFLRLFSLLFIISVCVWVLKECSSICLFVQWAENAEGQQPQAAYFFFLSNKMLSLTDLLFYAQGEKIEGCFRKLIL